MGQRSHILVRIKGDKGTINIANYYQWNYGERMVSRAAHGLDFLKMREGYYDRVQLENIWDVNFDMGDYQRHINLLEEFPEDKSFRDVGFGGDGGLCVLVNGDEISYAFATFDGDKPLDAESYMKADIAFGDKTVEDYLKNNKCKTSYMRNKRILSHFHLMTQEEFDEFLDEDIREEASRE